ncbi:hypothetical protein TNCV_2788521 [Trichonephila clavipes]|uniref:Uncharacterized protein n=1 Tax=Trichonephila clavipes TaxID=2585209 RepID=A0A8X6VQS9_TRICX|nr:hypothetical protein TNCV_2788521 [Trichonephila clavipes]
MRGTTSNGGVDGWASRAEHVKSAAIPNVLRPGTFLWFEKTYWPPSEGATYAWMAADEAVGCTRALFTMWPFSPRLFCRERREPGHRVNDILRKSLKTSLTISL